MSTSDAFEKAREAVEAGRTLEGRLLLAAGITEAAREEGVTPVVSGGTSVDFYAAETLEGGPDWPRGWTPSEDLDLLNLASDSLGGARTIRRLLDGLGFEPAGGRDSPLGIDDERGWIPPDVPVAVEVIGGEFEGSRDHLVTAEVDGHEAILRGPEDTLLEHLDWADHTGDQRSWTRALAVAAAQRERLDEAYLDERVEERGLGEALERCLEGEPLR